MRNKIFYTFIESLSVKKIRRLMKLFDDYNQLKGADEKLLNSLDFLTKRDIEKLLSGFKQIDVDREVDRLAKKEVNITFYGDEDYPKRLYDIANPPWGLYYLGALPRDDRPSVSIIGARACSEYGKNTAAYFAKELAGKGVQIISGMASGVDGVAQRKALEHGLTFGVLGCGIDVCYPISNRDLYDGLKEKGGIISEYPLGSKPEAYRFPMRNRIISGLSDIVLVTEAKEKSGTAITVSMALEQGKDVFAVPGRIGDKLSMGCNKLIKDGAGMALSSDDILFELDQRRSCNCYSKKDNYGGFYGGENETENLTFHGSKEAEMGEYTKMSMEEAYISRVIGVKSMFIDELWKVINEEKLVDMKSISELSVILANMEICGILANRNGCYELI